ncbi:peptidoglycan-binding protein, partial [Streptomyces boluensis]
TTPVPQEQSQEQPHEQPYVPPPEPRRRRVAVLSVAGAALAVVAVTAAASGLFSGPPEREQALPDQRSTAPSTPLTTAPSRTGTPSASPEATATPSSSPTATPLRTAPPSRSPSTTAPPPTASATGSIGTPRSPEKPVLTKGDRGAEVRELQNRLAQLYLYAGPEDGTYGVLVEDAVERYQYARGVDSDPPGVYGPATREALESETEEPERDASGGR